MSCLEQSQSSDHDAITWFTESQLQLVIRNGVIPKWFHGIISRKEAEEQLMSRPTGYFLIRVSQSRIGYSLSYRAKDRCRHFMIDASEDGHYILVGEPRQHRCLQDMVDFHKRIPVKPFSEVLTVPCGQISDDETDYTELLFPRRHPQPNTSWLPTNSLHGSIDHPSSQVPPVLPYRSNNLNSSVLAPDQLYLNVEEERPRVPLPLPGLLVIRKTSTADNPPSNQPPQLPARISLPPLKQNQACITPPSESPFTPTATEQPVSGNIQPARNQEAAQSSPGGRSVVSNLRNLRKKFQKKKSMLPESAEVNMETTESSGNTANEYRFIPGPQISNAQPFSYTCTNVRPTDERLPYEYLPPPPFAPGF